MQDYALASVDVRENQPLREADRLNAVPLWLMIGRAGRVNARTGIVARAPRVAIHALDEIGVLAHPALAHQYNNHVIALAKAVYDPELGQGAFEALRGTVDEVRLTPVDGQLTIELVGKLAGILRVAASGDQDAEKIEKSALQIKMVAGAGYEPTIFQVV